MTRDNPPPHPPGVQPGDCAASKHKGCCLSRVSFAKGEVRVVVEQPADAVDRERYNSAHRQCLLHMAASPPTSFDCETGGMVSAPRTEVILQRSVLQQLPLLGDISNNTSTEEGHGKDTEFELPCSVWGFVSLLLLLEGDVKLSHWFDVDSDPSLPAQTLLAADFLGCKGIRKAIIEHLHTLLISSVEQSEKNVAAQATPPDAVLSVAVHQTYTRNWHNIQVLRQLPESFTADVFGKLTERSGTVLKGFESALHLPQDLLARWIACADPVLDLRSAELTALQWSRLFIPLVQEGTHLTELHVRALVAKQGAGASYGSSLMQFVEQCSKNQPPRKVCSVCRSLRNQNGCGSTAQQGVNVVTVCTRFQECGHNEQQNNGAPRVPLADALNQLCSVDVSVAQCAQVLSTLAGVLPQLPSLKHIGLHNLPLQPQLLPALGLVLLDLPPSVTALTLTTGEAAEQPALGPAQRGMLFKAVALVKSLRELHMPDWEAIVGHDIACVEPLYRLLHLEAVYVPEVKPTAAFPAGLTFKAIEGASPSS